MHAKSFNQEAHSRLKVLGAVTKLSNDFRVVVFKRTHEDFVNLAFTLLALEALLNHIRREFELTEVDEVVSNVLEYLFIQFRLL